MKKDTKKAADQKQKPLETSQIKPIKQSGGPGGDPQSGVGFNFPESKKEKNST